MPDLKRAFTGGHSIKVGLIADQTGPLSSWASPMPMSPAWSSIVINEGVVCLVGT